MGGTASPSGSSNPSRSSNSIVCRVFSREHGVHKTLARGSCKTGLQGVGLDVLGVPRTMPWSPTTSMGLIPAPAISPQRRSGNPGLRLYGGPTGLPHPHPYPRSQLGSQESLAPPQSKHDPRCPALAPDFLPPPRHEAPAPSARTRAQGRGPPAVSSQNTGCSPFGSLGTSPGSDPTRLDTC